MEITEELLDALRERIARGYSRKNLTDLAAELDKVLPDVWVEEKFLNFRQLAEGLGNTPNVVILAMVR